MSSEHLMYVQFTPSIQGSEQLNHEVAFCRTPNFADYFWFFVERLGEVGF